jgi:hypothetical protein
MRDRGVRRLALILALAWLSLAWMQGKARAQDNKTPGEVQFSADTTTERDAGVWIDGKYAGYLRELKGNRKIMLPPGQHEVIVREAGYKDFTQKIAVEAGQVQTVAVSLEEDHAVVYPGADAATLRIDVKPKQAAVFIDGGYMGHGSDFGGRFHSMLVSPGAHHLRIALPGYRSYETEINVVALQKAEIKTELVKGGDDQTAPATK